MKYIIGLQASDLIACCAVVMALSSLLVAIWQGRLMLIHNKLSVKPLLVWTRRTSHDDHSITLNFSIRNVGIGPAIIKNRICKCNGESIQVLSNGNVKIIIDRLLGDSVRYVVRHHGLPAIDSAIPAGNESVIASIQLLHTDDASLELAESLLTLHVSFTYVSLYGDQSEVSN